jgi:hypothetical protein
LKPSGKVYETIGNLQEVTKWLREAKNSYQSLGDLRHVQQLEQELKALPQPE